MTMKNIDVFTMPSAINRIHCNNCILKLQMANLNHKNIQVVFLFSPKYIKFSEYY